MFTETRCNRGDVCLSLAQTPVYESEASVQAV